MDYNQIKELIKMLDDSSFNSAEIRMGGDVLRLSKAAELPASDTPVIITTEAKPEAKPEPAVAPHKPATSAPVSAKEEKLGNLVTSPIVGTFYASASPGKPPLATVGKKVKKGDALCIVEAMKVMNEIVSKYDGTIAEILVENEAVVEFNQPLFRIE